ncbi:HAMP domain protein [Rickettsia felis str. Pedreira]|uniref:Putative sensor histidine kinase NtrY-like n=2 Tax=Rickettsia felis TaxID=42862 RepID=NTRYL_RICFE|nr:PAS domain-containing sensor histidine kinase [Rickettsia felis]Q4UMD4.1 RecName: Full=Putative sensor histidine kinase NtrY-like [Rickettsia felis URRWXCal2]AAY61278.1 Nitrogen regulation protein NtrY [Rickettsia felis URRWXCal2]KJV58490.1 HAMP domain protein [Rickettsia felis str. Pedreira]MDE8611708.1 PAS domain-containing sensor histidine kinase [Rickettsia felis]
MLSYLKKNLRSYFSSRVLIFTLAIAAIIFACATFYVISLESKNFSTIIGFLLVDLAIFLILGVLLTQKFFTQNSNNDSSKLQNRIVIAFSLVAAIPTIIVSVFSVYFFNLSVQAWFDKKISTVLDQSVIVAESYIAEHKLQLKETALAVAEDLSDMYYDLIHNPALFTKTLNTEAEMRSLDEAIVLNKSTNTIVANSYLSFSLSFATIPAHLIKKADLGEPVEVKSDPTKIRMLIKLKEYNDVYLLVGRLVDNKIIDHIDATNGAAAEYNSLKNEIDNIQIKFSIMFIFIALLLLFVAISFGVIFTAKIVKPIKKLVTATDKVKDGDLTVQVPENEVDKDEIGTLYAAFNRMIKQLSRQQRDLVIAQRAMAWSDVAKKVAHEIKNPLTPILLASERLLKKFSPEIKEKEEFENYLKMIIRHTNDIKNIVSEFVLFARLPAPKFTKSELVYLVKHIVEARKLLNDNILYKFESNVDQFDFMCDATQINQVMINLLKNAEESIEGRESGKIEVTIDAKDDFISVIVIDSGKGFPPELIGKATESYVTTSSKGMGVGLAIVKRIVEEHCGILDIANREEEGAIIDIKFDLKKLDLKVGRSGG